MPVDGLKTSLVEETFCGRFPVVVVTHVGYTEALVVVSSVIAVLVAFVAEVALVAVAALAATMLVLHPNPELVVQVSALLELLQLPTDKALMFAVPEVEFPSTVLVAICARLASVTPLVVL